MTVIRSVVGLASREPLKTKWDLNVGNAWKPWRVGRGMLGLTGGKKASLI